MTEASWARVQPRPGGVTGGYADPPRLGRSKPLRPRRGSKAAAAQPGLHNLRLRPMIQGSSLGSWGFCASLGRLGGSQLDHRSSWLSRFDCASESGRSSRSEIV